MKIKILVGVFFSIIGLILVLFNSKDIAIIIVLIGSLSIIHAFYTFYDDGNNIVTPNGVYMIISALLGGFPAVYLIVVFDYSPKIGHFYAIVVIYISQILVAIFSKKSDLGRKPHMPKCKVVAIDYDIKIWSFKVGLGILIPGTILSFLSPQLQFLSRDSLYLSILIVLSGRFCTKQKLTFLDFIIVIFLFLVYYLNEFDGFGRINLLSLAIASFLTFGYKYDMKIVKLLSIIMFYPMIIVGSVLRGGKIGDVTGGIGSMISPFERFGELIQLYIDGALKLSFGKTIWAALVTPIPRAFWPNKPWNFNREITYIFTPQYVDAGHSEASIIYAEWFFNFGYIGIIIGIAMMCLFLFKLNGKYYSYLYKRDWIKSDVISFTSVIVLISGIVDLFWGGFSTFMSRAGFRLIVLFVFVITMKALSRLSKIKSISK